jgi:cation transport regulator ChaC
VRRAGSSAEYLFETCKGLREHAINDADLETPEAEVAAACLDL